MFDVFLRLQVWKQIGILSILGSDSACIEQVAEKNQKTTFSFSESTVFYYTILNHGFRRRD